LKSSNPSVRFVLAFLFLASPAIPGQILAQERIETPFDWVDASLRVGVFAGNLSSDRGSLGIGPGGSTTFGARLRARVSSPLSLEIGFGLGNSERAVIDPRLPAGPAPVDTVNADWLVIEGGFQIALTGSRTLHQLQPYIVLTGGVLKGRGEEVSDSLMAAEDVPFQYNIGTASMFTAGAGVEWIPNGRIGLGLEVRDRLWRIKAPDGFFRLDVLQNIEDLGLEAPQESEWTHNIELSASLYYYF
jgi:hypothetical protein